jgi:hypothetical protein
MIEAVTVGPNAFAVVARRAARVLVAPVVERHLLQNTPGYDPSCLVDWKYFRLYIRYETSKTLIVDRDTSRFLFMSSCEHLFICGERRERDGEDAGDRNVGAAVTTRLGVIARALCFSPRTADGR